MINFPLGSLNGVVGTKTHDDQASWDQIRTHMRPTHPFGPTTAFNPVPSPTNNLFGDKPSFIANSIRPPTHPTESAFLYEHDMNPKQPVFDGSEYYCCDTSTRDITTYPNPYNFRIEFGEQKGDACRAIQFPKVLRSVAGIAFTDIRIPSRFLSQSEITSHMILRIRELHAENQYFSNPKINQTTDILLDVTRIDGGFVHLRSSNPLEWTYNRPTFTAWTCSFLTRQGLPIGNLRTDLSHPDNPEMWEMVMVPHLSHGFIQTYQDKEWFGDFDKCHNTMSDAMKPDVWSKLNATEKAEVRNIARYFKKSRNQIRLNEMDPEHETNNTHLSFRVVGEQSRPIQTVQSNKH